MFRGSVEGTGYPLHSPVSPSLPLLCVTVCHQISTGVYFRSVCLCVCVCIHTHIHTYTHTHTNTHTHIYIKVKVKCSRYRSGVAQRVGRGIALLLHDRGTRRGEWSAARPGRTLPPGNTGYSFYRRLGGPQGRSGRAENLFPTGIRSRTIQPVISRYTDWATWPNNECELLFENNHIISFTSAY